MSDLTDPQRIERARRAGMALEEFIDPAFAVVAEEYRQRLEAVCAAKPWATNEIAALANASRIVSEVRNQIAGLVYDGEEAKRGRERAKKIASLSPTQRRLLQIGSY